MKNILLFILFILGLVGVKGQDSTQPQVKKQGMLSDTIPAGHVQKKGIGNMAMPDRRKLEYFRDTVRRERRKFDSALFSEIKIPSSSDYAEDLGKVYELLNSESVVAETFVKLPAIRDYLNQGDSVLVVLKERLFQNDRSFHIRNLQMFNALLDVLAKNTDYYRENLRQYDSALDGVREDILNLQRDTLMRQLFRDTSLRNAFQPQLQQLKVKWRQVDSLVSENGKEINTLKSQASAHEITIGELLFQVDASLKSVGTEAFGKERRYLWEPTNSAVDYSEDSFSDSMKGEIQMAGIYFSNTSIRRIWLIAIGLLFFFWVRSNFHTLRRLNKLEAIENFQIKYINPFPLIGSLIFSFSLAPLFDLQAPSIYLESVELALMVLLTSLFLRHLERRLFFGWCVFMFLFLLMLTTRAIGLSLNFQRWANFVIDSTSVVFGLYFLVRYSRKCANWILFAVGFYILFNLLASISNLFGRVTFSQIFGYTAIYSFAQTISLGVFVKLVQESFLLQIQTSRIRKKYTQEFSYMDISRSIRRFSMFLAVPLWLIVFATNLNLFDTLHDWLVTFFDSNRQVGNFSFTLGGILLFLGIIWLSNFLQKYIAYFFGDTGDDSAFDDKGQRSRLMVTRLILLIAGFLLAVAASGLAVDRITVILGALGVGIGLGLQSIVNNFVSGVILIFDRPLRIGDTVDIGDKRGRVKEIGIRTSTLLTEEGAEVIIPNGDVLAHNIINWTLSNNHVRQVISFTLDKPIDKAMIGMDAIKEIILKNSNVLEQRPPEIMVDALNSKNIELKIYFWLQDFNKGPITVAEVKAEIYQYLEKSGLTIS
jgi:potassium-dependent mechanosensitive channel